MLCPLSQTGPLEIGIECCLYDVRIMESGHEFCHHGSALLIEIVGVDHLHLFLIIEGIADQKDVKVRRFRVLIDTGLRKIYG